MKINTLKLINFRNYENIKINFNDKLNIIYGDNGSGKTNLVEAIYVLSLTKSFRTNNDKNLIKKGKEYTKAEGIIENNNITSYQVIISKEGKKVKINDNLKSKISDYITNINIIILKPDEQNIFSSSPHLRRRLLNIEISKLDKSYILYLNDYNKILKQRNFYLRELLINGNSSKDYLNILTKKLVDYGIKIYELRKDFIDNINKYIEEFYQKIFKKGNIKIKYISNYKNKSYEEIINCYKKNYHKEINLGKTLFGIHHDDIEFILDDENINNYGSNGQQKNAVLAFKLSEIKVCYDKNNDYPILILDDLFSALDDKIKKNIIKVLDMNIQTFITTTELNKINKNLLKNAKIIKIENNLIMEE